MAEPTLNHHASLALTADAEDVAASVVPLFVILGSCTTGGRLNRISWLVRQIEAMLVFVLHKLHVLVQDMHLCVGFSEKLLSFCYPILLPSLLLFEIYCPFLLSF